MKYKGVIIPGLTMEKHELPDIHGFLRLQNPEIADGFKFSGQYDVEDIANLHVETISKLDTDETFHVIGMSLGGMIAAVMASQLRSKLPSSCTFHLFVTPVNSRENPAIPDETLADWKTVDFSDEAEMKRTLLPFFSEDFLEKNPTKFKEYLRYKTTSGNQQTPIALLRQIEAVRNFDGIKYYSQVNQQECRFLHGSKDRVITEVFHEELKKICPNAVHQTEEVGHMLNIEKPELFKVV